MANVNIKPAAAGMYSHKYNPMTIGSIDFGDLLCSRCVEVEAGDKWNFNQVKGTLRLAPSVFPAFGKNTLKSAAFFVSSKQLVETYDSFRSNKRSWKSKPARVPFMEVHIINEMFYLSVGSQVPLCDLVGNSSNVSTMYSQLKANAIHWDLLFVDVNDTSSPYKFLALNALGKRYYKTLKSLGYDFGQYQFETSVSDVITNSVQNVNILPLLAYLKVYCDYFLNPYFYNSNGLVALLQNIHDTESTALTQYYDVLNGLSVTGLRFCLDSVLVPYERNMYLEAWNSPNSPDGVSPSLREYDFNKQGVTSPFIPETKAQNASSVTEYFTETAVSDENSSYLRSSIRTDSGPIPAENLGTLSALGQRFLDSVYKFVRRNNLSGSKPIQDFFARFGIKPSDWNNDVASKLYEGVSEIDYSAVVSQTDSYQAGSGGSSSSGKSLGSYAGFGVSGLNFKFDYKSSDCGYIIVLHWIQITPLLLHGFDPMTLRLHPLDFYSPEFDGQSIRAIPQMEISQDKGSGIVGNNGPKKIFGFTDIYDEYRQMRDTVIGDFVTDESNEGCNNFLFARDLSYWRELNNIALKPQTDRIQYYARGGSFEDITNPFQWSSVNGDRFYLEVKYDISAKRKIMSKSSALDLNGEGEMNMQLGGTQMR